MDNSELRKLQKTRKLAGLLYSMGACKRSLDAGCSLTKEELETYTEELLRQCK